MQHVLQSRSNPANQLALDEALLLAAEAGELGETIRVWEINTPTVVIGRSTKVAFEVDQEFCRSEAIPILRRCSGGASIVAGPGCLMYSLVISLDANPGLRKIDAAHHHVMQRVLRATQTQLPATKLQGVCDLTWQNRKFSGNSLRISRNHLLYHGTILYSADVELLVKCLRQAPRQPEYRNSRSHENFITNAPIDPSRWTEQLLGCFEVNDPPLTELPQRRVDELLRTRYEKDAWNFRH